MYNNIKMSQEEVERMIRAELCAMDDGSICDQHKTCDTCDFDNRFPD